MPYLEKAVQVTVLQRHGSEDDAEIGQYLAVHGVRSVEFKTYGQSHLTARGWGRALLAETKAIGADLLVMGAYGSAMGTLLGDRERELQQITGAFVDELIPWEVEAEMNHGELPPDVAEAHKRKAEELGLT